MKVRDCVFKIYSAMKIYLQRIIEYTPAAIVGALAIAFLVEISSLSHRAVSRDSYDEDQRDIRASIDNIDLRLSTRIDSKFSDMDIKIENRFSTIRKQLKDDRKAELNALEKRLLKAIKELKKK